MRTKGRGGALAGAALAALAADVPGRAAACDVCAVYTVTEMRQSRVGLRLGVAEQFTSYSKLQDEGTEVANPAGERLESWITQLLLGYNFRPHVGLQLNLPVVSRQFRRQEAAGVVNSAETGVGDLSLLANVAPFTSVTENSVTRLSLIGGLKLPSGSSRRLKEELAAPHHHEEEEVQSGVHGHDLALGSGSTDVILGTQVFSSWQRAFVSAVVQYALRTQGDFGYEAANELTWSGGPGLFALLADGFTVGAQAIVSGESKGKDSIDSVKADDTARTGVYVGPGVLLTWGTSLAADLSVDLSVLQNNSALQVVPDYRVRGGVTWRF